ncbi:hypothetical protein [Terriglobus albidus]|nr:hypothetical protein [Terriglobus albidus]
MPWPETSTTGAVAQFLLWLGWKAKAFLAMLHSTRPADDGFLT